MNKKLTHKNTNIKILTTTVMVVLKRQKSKSPPLRESTTERGIEGSEGCGGERKKSMSREGVPAGQREGNPARQKERKMCERDEIERRGDEIGREGDEEKVRLWVRERRGR